MWMISPGRTGDGRIGPDAVLVSPRHPLVTAARPRCSGLALGRVVVAVELLTARGARPATALGRVLTYVTQLKALPGCAVVDGGGR
jgi:hypothetical protein